MKKNNFFANVASKALALAAVMMMSVAFTACSGDDNDTQPELVANTVTLDGVTNTVTTAKLTFQHNGSYWLTLSFEDYDILVVGLPEFHNGKTFDMTKPDGSDGVCWSIVAQKSQKILFTGDGSDNKKFQFSAGTLKTNVNKSTGEVEVTLAGGRITTDESTYLGDGKEHTISISWKGTPIKS